jgi:hypothetical protein
LESFSTKAERRGRVRLVQFDSTEKFKGNRFGRFAQVSVEREFFCTYCTVSLYNFEEANLLLFTTFRKNLRFGEAERAHIQ